jgi:hypothetical protein
MPSKLGRAGKTTRFEAAVKPVTTIQLLVAPETARVLTDLRWRAVVRRLIDRTVRPTKGDHPLAAVLAR